MIFSNHRFNKPSFAFTIMKSWLFGLYFNNLPMLLGVHFTSHIYIHCQTVYCKGKSFVAFVYLRLFGNNCKAFLSRSTNFLVHLSAGNDWTSSTN